MKTAPNLQAQEACYKVMFEEQLPLIQACQKGNPEALCELEVMSRPLRKSKAQKFLPNRPDLHQDAIQAAWTGILNSLRKWDPSWNRLFLAFAHWDISEAIREFKYEMELTVSRPTHMHRKLSKLTKFNTSDVDELSELTGLPADSVKGIMAIKHGDISLHGCQFEHEGDIGNSLVDTTEPHDSPTRALDRADLLKLLDEAISILDPREAHVVRLYYHTESTFGQIAETMNLTRQRVEQINANAIGKLQKYFLSKDPGLSIQPKKPRSTQHRKAGNSHRKALLKAAIAA